MYKEGVNIIQDNILLEALKIVPFHGWSQKTLEQASINAGYNQKMHHFFFQNGIISVVDLYLQSIDNLMVDEIRRLPLNKMKIRDKISQAIKIRINIQKNQKSVISRTLAYLGMPHNIGNSLKFLWRTVDIIWYEAGGDRSTDHNYYTKRSLLAAIYSSTLTYWLSDQSHDYIETFALVDRQIDNIVNIGMKLGKILPTTE